MNKSFLGYAKRIWLTGWQRHRGEVIGAYLVPLLIDCTQIYTQMQLGVMPKGNGWWFALAFLESYVPYFFGSVLLQIVVTSWWIYREQLISIETKQTIIDLNTKDLEEAVQRVRDSARRKAQREQDSQDRKAEDLGTEIKALKGRLDSYKPDVPRLIVAGVRIESRVRVYMVEGVISGARHQEYESMSFAIVTIKNDPLANTEACVAKAVGGEIVYRMPDSGGELLLVDARWIGKDAATVTMPESFDKRADLAIGERREIVIALKRLDMPTCNAISDVAAQRDTLIHHEARLPSGTIEAVLRLQGLHVDVTFTFRFENRGIGTALQDFQVVG